MSTGTYVRSVNPQQIVAKVMRRLALPLMILLLLNSVDRVNVSFAALQMNHELHLSAQSYGYGVSAFFAGYLALQLPSMWLLSKIGMRRWLFTISALWGAAATGMAFIHTASEFFALRVVLGIAEGGFAPGLIWYLSRWMPARYRARPISAIMLALPISIVFGGPLSGWLLNLHGAQWSGWRWMFLIEGLPTILMAIVAVRLLANAPSGAKWLSHDERRWLRRQMELEETNFDRRGTAFSGRLYSWPVSAAVLCWFSLMGGTYGIVYWLPQIVAHLSGISSNIEIGLITALPWVAVGTGMLINSWHSDKTLERYLHVALAIIGAGVFLGAAILAGSGIMGLVCLTVAGLGLGGANGVFWSIPPSLTSAARSGTVIALINMCGATSGLIIPALIGQLRTHTGSFEIPLVLLTALLVFGGVVLLLSRPRAVHSRLESLPEAH
jgi:MFS transporter, ACS family, tartrate transporter